MAFPESSILDNFNRGDEGPPLSANWTEAGYAAAGLKVDTNEAAPETAGSCIEYWNPATFGPACECYVTYSKVIPVGSKCGVLTRLQSPDTAETDGYILEADAVPVTDVFLNKRFPALVPLKPWSPRILVLPANTVPVPVPVGSPP